MTLSPLAVVLHMYDNFHATIWYQHIMKLDALHLSSTHRTFLFIHVCSSQKEFSPFCLETINLVFYQFSNVFIKRFTIVLT